MINIICNILRCCLNCGAKAGYGSVFCYVCRTTYKKEITFHWNTECEARHNHLFNVSGEHNKFLIQIKERESPLFQEWLMMSLLEKRSLLFPPLPKGPVLVPAPSSTGRTHAQRLAESLSKLTGWEVLDCLGKEASFQKTKTWGGRQQVEVWLTQSVPPRHIILVDDLVTTGATAKACKKALKNAKSFEVWAPYRTVLLCGNSASDITRSDEKA